MRTGALNTVQAGQVVFLESTAEGKEGHFYELCEAAQAKQRMGTPLTPLDFKFHFFPWWKAPEYELDPAGVVIGRTAAQILRASWKPCTASCCRPPSAPGTSKSPKCSSADMKREYPSTPEEAFEASVEGAYYGQELAAAELQGRIGHFPASPELPVHTAWDIGRGDYTAIWFWQRRPVGRLRAASTSSRTPARVCPTTPSSYASSRGQGLATKGRHRLRAARCPRDRVGHRPQPHRADVRASG